MRVSRSWSDRHRALVRSQCGADWVVGDCCRATLRRNGVARLADDSAHRGRTDRLDEGDECEGDDEPPQMADECSFDRLDRVGDDAEAVEGSVALADDRGGHTVVR